MEQTKVLVAEDEAISAISLKRALVQYGYKVCEVVSTGEDAITAAKHERPDVIIMDILLAGKIDGFEAAREIQSLADIPIVFLTGYTDDNIVKRMKEYRWAALLEKPILPEDIRLAIAEVLEMRKKGKQAITQS